MKSGSLRFSAKMLATVLVLIMLPTEVTASDNFDVHQTPPYMIKRLGEDSVDEMSCSHSITNYDVVLWYRQNRVGTLVLMGYLNQRSPFPEDDFKGKVDFSGNAQQRSGLIIKNLTLSDSAVYFCAASTVLQIGPRVVTKQATLISV